MLKSFSSSIKKTDQDSHFTFIETIYRFYGLSKHYSVLKVLTALRCRFDIIIAPVLHTSDCFTGSLAASTFSSFCSESSVKNLRRCPTFPPSCPGSIIGAEGLNFRVRNGNGCLPLASATAKVARVLGLGFRVLEKHSLEYSQRPKLEDQSPHQQR
jgi:hypothetical protein